MGRARRERLAVSARAAREVFKHRGLRNLELSLVLNWTADFGFVVALSVFAYEAGGTLAVGLLGLGRLLPAGVVALIGSAATDRYRRELVLQLIYVIRAATAAAAAALFFVEAAPIAVFMLGALVTVVSAALRPAYWALIPALARTPEQLTASNVVGSTSEGLALLVGPALGGIVLAATDAGTVFAGAAILFLASALFAVGVASGVRPPDVRRNIVAETVAGMRAVVGHRETRFLVWLGGAQTFIRGALMVLIVVASLRLLDMGEAGVGFLNAAFGVGNLVGAVVSFALVGRRRLGGPLVVGLLLWGLPIAAIGIVPEPAVALVLLALPGWGNAVFDIALLTMLQRSTPDDVLGRVFGTLETVVFASMAVGSIAASGLVALFDVRAALIITGCMLPVVSVLTWRAIKRLDEEAEVPETELALLRRVPIFASLPGVALEHLAAKLQPLEVPDNTVIFKKGEPGDRFYVIADGSVEVLDAEGTLATLGEAGYFGEIALLRGVPRTATVATREPCTLYALAPEDFLAAMSRYEQCSRAADETVGARLRARTDGSAG